MEPARTYTIKPMLSIKSANTNHILCSRTEIEPQCDLIHQGSPNPQMNRSSRNKADESILSTSEAQRYDQESNTRHEQNRPVGQGFFSVVSFQKLWGYINLFFFFFPRLCKLHGASWKSGTRVALGHEEMMLPGPDTAGVASPVHHSTPTYDDDPDKNY
jgi:hypothetical protein